MGVSMISPEGLAIRPRMPASWRICWAEPRAPESAMMKIGLNEGARFFSPVSSLRMFSAPISFIISSAMSSETCAQMSTTLL
jgi:hypothetical protein